MSTLYIRLPSRAAADSVQPGTPLYCQFALASDGGAVERDGVAALPEMTELVRRAQQVVLLLAASDVTLLRIKVPPMSVARLRAALPNMVEDQLMNDPAENVIIAGDTRDEMRAVAVVHRGWLELLSKTMTSLGARKVSAVPSQLCLPYVEGTAVAAITEYGNDIDIAVRLSEHEGLGLPIVPDQPESAPVDVLQALAAIVPHAPVILYVPQTRVGNYEDALVVVPALHERIQLMVDDWSHWIEGASRRRLDLMTGLGMATGPSFNWRPWRWPIALAAALLLVNAVGLNIDWLRMKREADALHGVMIQTYRSAYPKETVIIDPLAQLRQKVAAGQRESGQLAPDDFVALAAAFGEAWAGAGQSPQEIAGLEYRDRGLSVKLKPDTQMPVDQIKAALTARNLSVSQSSDNVWQIRSAK